MSPYADLKALCGKEEKLQFLLIDILLNEFCNAFNASPSSIIEEHWRCIYQLICEHPSLIIQYGSSVLSSAQIQAISKNLGSLVNNINTVGKYDPTKVKTISKQGEKSIYMSIFAVFRVMNDAITSNPTKPMHVANADQKAAAIQQFVRSIKRFDTQKLFSAPVTPDIAANYTSIVHHPMDLSTMYRKASLYSSLNEIQEDLNTIVGNSKLYNGPDSFITKMAEELVSKSKPELEQLSRLFSPTMPSSHRLSSSVDLLQFLFIELGILLHDPHLYAQLLRAIWQRLLYLIGQNTAPVDNGKLDPILYQYCNLALLIEHTLSITHSIDKSTSAGEWQPRWLLGDTVQLLPATFGETLNLLAQLVVQRMQGLSDSDTLTSLYQECRHAGNLHLLLAATASQLQRAALSTDETERLVLRGLLEAVAGLPAQTLYQEWVWVEAICVTLLAVDVGMMMGFYVDADAARVCGGGGGAIAASGAEE